MLKIKVFLLANYIPAAENFDTTGNWGQNIRDWIVNQAYALALAVIVIIIIPLIYKREWSKLIGTIFASGIALFVISNPENLLAIGKTIYGIVFAK